MPPTLDPQLALDEKAINHADLEAALERRLRAQDDVAEARGVFTLADTEVKGYVEKIDIPTDTAIRVGRFRIAKVHRDGRSVSFDTEPKDQLTIGLVDADGNVVRRPRATAEKSVSDDEDLRPTGEVNTDALRGIADRSSEPTPIKPAPLN